MSIPRPRTSTPRGFCRYYSTERGCYAGAQCKFLHAQPPEEAGSSKAAAQELSELTPYDQSKVCFYYAAGYCRRGESCWFRHVQESPLSAEETEPEPCSICLEIPVTYGLLVNCSHVFCIQCVRQWRAAKHDVSWSGANKACPLCRVASPAVIPSSHFYPVSKPGVPSPREAIIANYRASCKRIQCKYFEESKQRSHGILWCPFGRDCFYKHEKADGSLHQFEQGIVGRRGLLPPPRVFRSSRSSTRDYTDIIALLSQLLHAPLHLLREALSVAPLGINAVLDMLAMVPVPLTDEDNLLDDFDIAEAIQLSSTIIPQGSDSIMDEMRMRMELIYRLGQRLSGEGDDAESGDDGPPFTPDEPDFDFNPTRFPTLPAEASLSPPLIAGDINDEPPDLLEISDSSEEEYEEEEVVEMEMEVDGDIEEQWYDEDDVEIHMPGILEFSPVAYHLWTQRSHPSRPVMRRRRSSSPPPLEPVSPSSNSDSAELEEVEEIPVHVVSPPPPPPPGPYTTDGRGRPVFWSTEEQSTADSGPSSNRIK